MSDNFNPDLETQEQIRGRMGAVATAQGFIAGRYQMPPVIITGGDGSRIVYAMQNPLTREITPLDPIEVTIDLTPEMYCQDGFYREIATKRLGKGNVHIKDTEGGQQQIAVIPTEDDIAIIGISPELIIALTSVEEFAHAAYVAKAGIGEPDINPEVRRTMTIPQYDAIPTEFFALIQQIMFVEILEEDDDLRAQLKIGEATNLVPTKTKLTKRFNNALLYLEPSRGLASALNGILDIYAHSPFLNDRIYEVLAVAYGTPILRNETNGVQPRDVLDLAQLDQLSEWGGTLTVSVADATSEIARTEKRKVDIDLAPSEIRIISDIKKFTITIGRKLTRDSDGLFNIEPNPTRIEIRKFEFGQQTLVDISDPDLTKALSLLNPVLRSIYRLGSTDGRGYRISINNNELDIETLTRVQKYLSENALAQNLLLGKGAGASAANSSRDNRLKIQGPDGELILYATTGDLIVRKGNPQVKVEEHIDSRFPAATRSTETVQLPQEIYLSPEFYHPSAAAMPNYGAEINPDTLKMTARLRKDTYVRCDAIDLLNFINGHIDTLEIAHTNTQNGEQGQIIQVIDLQIQRNNENVILSTRTGSVSEKYEYADSAKDVLHAFSLLALYLILPEDFDGSLVLETDYGTVNPFSPRDPLLKTNGGIAGELLQEFRNLGISSMDTMISEILDAVVNFSVHKAGYSPINSSSTPVDFNKYLLKFSSLNIVLQKI